MRQKKHIASIGNAPQPPEAIVALWRSSPSCPRVNLGPGCPISSRAIFYIKWRSTAQISSALVAREPQRA